MPGRVQLLRVADFTAGLNLVLDPFKIEPGESPDLLNVDLDAKGGVRLRRGSSQFGASTVLAGDPMFIGEHVAADGTHRIIYGQGQSVFYISKTAPGAPVAIPWYLAGSWPGGAPATYGGPFRIAPFEALGIRRVYVQRNAENLACFIQSLTSTSSIDVSSLSAPPAWTESYAATNTNQMPKAKCICSHTGYMWVANTVEGSTAYKNRIRFSHPNVPTAWRANDYIDVSGLDGDEITGLASNGDHLLVFQNNSTHAVYGYSPETFQFITVSETVGAVSQEAIASTPGGTFAFDAERGVYLHSGKRAPEWQFERIYPALRDHRIPQANLLAYTRLGWTDGRLWVTVPYQATTDDPVGPTTFVLDPTLSKDGSWTRNTLGMVAYYSDLEGNHLGSRRGTNRIQRLEQDNLSTDSGTAIESYYRTAWYDLGHHAVRKRWKRFEAVVGGGVEQTILAYAYRDYDTSAADRIIDLNIEARDPDLVWTVSNWDEASWRRLGTYDVIAKGGALGPARAVQLRFVGPTTPWTLDAFTLKYINKRIR